MDTEQTRIGDRYLKGLGHQREHEAGSGLEYFILLKKPDHRIDRCFELDTVTAELHRSGVANIGAPASIRRASLEPVETLLLDSDPARAGRP